MKTPCAVIDTGSHFTKELIEVYQEKGNQNSDQKKQVYVVYLTDGLLHDRMHELAVEYTIPVERLTELAVERLIQDVKFVRGLRSGKVTGT